MLVDGDGRPEARRGRWWVRGVLAVGVLALTAGIVQLATEEPDSSLIEVRGAGDAQRIFGGIEQRGDTLGPSDAPVTVTLFNDLQCETCDEYYLDTVPRLVEDLARPGEARLDYRHYSFGSTEQELGFFGAEAAAEQEYGWQYVYLFFRNQGEADRRGVTDELLRSLAGAVLELDLPQWREDYERALEEGSAVRRRLERDDRAAEALELRAEPAAVVDGPAGIRNLQDSPSVREIEAAVRAVT